MFTARYEANCPINPSKISQLYYGFHGFSLSSEASQIFLTLLVSDSATTAVNISFRSNTASAHSNLLSALHDHTTLHYPVLYRTSNLTFREGRTDTVWEFYSSAFCQFVTKVSCLFLFAFCVPPSNFRS